MSLAERLKQSDAERIHAAQEAFRSIVRREASGEEIPLAEGSEILQAAGKSPEDFAKAVAQMRERISHRQTIAQRPALEAQRSSIAEKIGKAVQKFRQAEEQHELTVFPLQNELQQIDQQIRATQESEAALIRSCPYTNLVERVAEIDRETGILSQDKSELASTIQRLTVMIDSIRHKSATEFDDGVPTNIPKAAVAEIEAIEEKLRLHRAKFDAIPKRLASLAEERAAISVQMLEP